MGILYDETPLGRKSDYVKDYTPALLCPIPRWDGRESLELENPEALPFRGVDVWNHYEVSWLDGKGLPQVGVAAILVPANSRFIIESKSMKLYFNSLNFTRFERKSDFIQLLEADLSQAAQAPVQVTLHSAQTLEGTAIGELPGICLDQQDLSFDNKAFVLNPLHLQADPKEVVSEQLYSHLLRSNCPVTHQPDWGSVLIRYRGPAINHSGLLRYIVSYRDHADFHEQCVERIFMDILRQCQPSQLTVYARYTRRGGLDINPFRSNFEEWPANMRLFRQ